MRKTGDPTDRPAGRSRPFHYYGTLYIPFPCRACSFPCLQPGFPARHFVCHFSRMRNSGGWKAVRCACLERPSWLFAGVGVPVCRVVPASAPGSRRFREERKGRTENGRFRFVLEAECGAHHDPLARGAAGTAVRHPLRNGASTRFSLAGGRLKERVPRSLHPCRDPATLQAPHPQRPLPAMVD